MNFERRDSSTVVPFQTQLFLLSHRIRWPLNIERQTSSIRYTRQNCVTKHTYIFYLLRSRDNESYLFSLRHAFFSFFLSLSLPSCVIRWAAELIFVLFVIFFPFVCFLVFPYCIVQFNRFFVVANQIEARLCKNKKSIDSLKLGPPCKETDRNGMKWQVYKT